ncbi:MarR family transcriptional regulator [Luteolibacter pohnpeiensis]|uniref:MarR family transcriptional regulator n=1 Tax=Luteolibacter pohnpeiensis TaxID=454153 RepID=A0A934VRY2_9BACT|nr:MarR family transcriptional regulator [Luteolibacter pohnpeiensis]MBK1883686.1 MarR family transcriptional regulator [Luteolibacter pohnpeiensis]
MKQYEKLLQLARNENLSRAGVHTLVCLASAEGNMLGLKELVNRCGGSPASYTSVIDTLAERGLVARETTEKDRRKYMIRLTRAGKKLIGKLEGEAV